VKVRAQLDTPPDAVVIVQASRMEEWKGHRLLIDALHLLRDLPGWVCWIVGGAQRLQESVYLQRLKTLAVRREVSDRVRFLGQRMDVARLFSAADIYCQPNIGAEPFGIAFVEALSAGLPVVATALGGAAEIVNRSCGVMVEAGDAQLLADELRKLINDQNERQRLSANGPERAAHLCDPRRQLNRLHTILENIAHADGVDGDTLSVAGVQRESGPSIASKSQSKRNNTSEKTIASRRSLQPSNVDD
jgi:glycosyltransferase involved in cell wall biosynthesis